jgi:hypothetical protein
VDPLNAQFDTLRFLAYNEWERGCEFDFECIEILEIGFLLDKVDLEIDCGYHLTMRIHSVAYIDPFYLFYRILFKFPKNTKNC